MSLNTADTANKQDLAIWLSFKEGDWGAYTELYNRHFKKLNNYGYKFTRDIKVIEDSVHDLFIKLWTNRAGLGTPSSVKNYLFKSLRSVLFRKLNTESRFLKIEDGTEYDFTFEVSFDQQYIADEQARDLQKKIKMVVQTLPARQQEIIYLRFYEGLGYEEIADIMEININSAYKLLYKALNKMQEVLKVSKLAIILSLVALLRANVNIK
ncbi:RNA polymerase [Mucilaginibacter sp. PAMC 26640]|nr:RNA polymerase [Mucilaginibacter sp. PAMC 26640]